MELKTGLIRGRPVHWLALLLLLAALVLSLLWADVLCRPILPRSEMPIGILTSIIGAPCFIFLMVRKKYGFGAANEN